jgi:penicillin amidase
MATSPLWKRLQILVSVLSLLLLVALGAVAWGWWRIRSSLPPLDGTLAMPGLSAPVRIERDARGVPTVTGATRVDVARALGFLHAQDRFFQMDLLRRSGAGELAALFGAAAVSLDESHRLHGFRRLAEKSVSTMTGQHRAVLEAYTAGVNAGLAALPKSPWEYLLLRAAPEPWRNEDSLLVAYAMWFDLQDATAKLELSLQAWRNTLGQPAVDFFAPRGTSWDAALDGSLFPEPAVPRLRLRRGDDPPEPAAVELEHSPPGSNSFALAGAHGAGGGALLANDMHLNLNLPHIWYRAVLRWTDANGTERRLVGVTLPGVPALVVGSNGAIAWGYTNSYIDTMDVVTVEADATAQAFYRTVNGYREIEERKEIIAVKGADPVTLTTRWTEWGPIIGAAPNSRLQALRWNAHDPESTNLGGLDLEGAQTVDEAIAAAHRMGIPNQNIVVADRAGNIAWTVTGRIPRRVGYDGRYPVSWAYGDRRWDGWLASEETPVIRNPAEGILWTANQRLVGGEAYAKLGDNGYDDGPRGRQIRDDLRALVAAGRPATPADCLGVMLDDRAVFLARWQEFMLTVLTDEAVAEKSARGELRETLRQWDGRAGLNSPAFRIVRVFRSATGRHALGPFADVARAEYPALDAREFQTEDALWRLVHERPQHLLNPKFPTWDALLLAAVDDVLADVDRTGVPTDRFTWGSQNRLKMRHPFSRILPAGIGSFLDMPGQPLPGASEMPRVQGQSFGASERLVVSPGREEEGLFHMPGGQSGNPLSPFYRAGHDDWVQGRPTPLLPGKTEHTLELRP